MAEKYIKASECEKYFYEHLDDNGMIGAMNAIDEIPAADVQPVKRGHWIEKSEEYYRLWQDSGRSWEDMPYFITGLHFACGVCFDEYEINAEGVEFWDFCPHCGADMRGEDNG